MELSAANVLSLCNTFKYWSVQNGHLGNWRWSFIYLTKYWLFKVTMHVLFKDMSIFIKCTMETFICMQGGVFCLFINNLVTFKKCYLWFDMLMKYYTSKWTKLLHFLDLSCSLFSLTKSSNYIRFLACNVGLQSLKSVGPSEYRFWFRLWSSSIKSIHWPVDTRIIDLSSCSLLSWVGWLLGLWDSYGLVGLDELLRRGGRFLTILTICTKLKLLVWLNHWCQNLVHLFQCGKQICNVHLLARTVLISRPDARIGQIIRTSAQLYNSRFFVGGMTTSSYQHSLERSWDK